VVENSGSGNGKAGAGTGVGLENVRRRLEICYGRSAELTLALTATGARAQLTIPVGRAVNAGQRA
jgi:LytS/YehU family sensor histidine kinase